MNPHNLIGTILINQIIYKPNLDKQSGPGAAEPASPSSPWLAHAWGMRPRQIPSFSSSYTGSSNIYEIIIALIWGDILLSNN